MDVLGVCAIWFVLSWERDTSPDPPRITVPAMRSFSRVGLGAVSAATMATSTFGLAIGAPLLGWSVDFLDTYAPGWIATAPLLGASGLIAFKIPPGSTIDAS